MTRREQVFDTNERKELQNLADTMHIGRMVFVPEANNQEHINPI